MSASLALAAALVAAHLGSTSVPRFAIYPATREIHLDLRVKVAHLTDLVDFGGGLARTPAPGEDRGPPPSLTEGALLARLPAIRALVEPGLRVENEGAALDPVFEDARVTRRGEALDEIALRFRFVSPGALGRVRIGCALFATHDPAHRGVGKVSLGVAEHPFVFRPGTVFEIDATAARAPSRLATLRAFALHGMEHIFSGADHLAFLAGLLLAAAGLRALLAAVTGFTIGHSTTLVSASLGWFSLPASIVEPAIAASVAWVGIENLLPGDRRRRFLLAGAFGLVHGLGFAGFVREVGLPAGATAVSLAGFNLGVEAGQAVIVCLAFPVLSWVRERNARLYRTVVLRGGSALLAGLGLVWLVLRLR